MCPGLKAGTTSVDGKLLKTTNRRKIVGVLKRKN